MLSVCIPVHNKNITQLLSELSRQFESISDLVELLVFDDGSSCPVHDGLHLFPGVKFIYSKENVGRSAARNQLIKEAKGPYVLFLDAGSEILNPRFLEDWISVLNKGESMVYFGGSDYPTTPPEKSFQLRWRVGVARESKSWDFRKRYQTTFKTNNSVLHQQVFDRLKFDESLRTYGHEDTLFGFELSQIGMEVRQVNIPVMNQIKDSNEAFLKKTKSAVDNLILAQQRSSSPERFKHYVKLLNTYEKIKALRLESLLTLLEKTIKVRIEKRLKRGDSFLMQQRFDLYKLLLLHEALRKRC